MICSNPRGGVQNKKALKKDKNSSIFISKRYNTLAHALLYRGKSPIGGGDLNEKR
jgi:hypothetical protein